jgi:carbonic anhydrase
MSVFGSQTTWAESNKACGAPHQSPVNLSQSFALPCDLLCEFDFDEVSIPDAQVSIDSDGVLMLSFNDVRPTAKYKGDGYTAYTAKFYHPSQHTLEGVQAEGEFVVYFSNPAGKTLNVSVLVRTSPSTSNSTQLFSAFVPFANTESPSTVGLGSNWTLRAMVPSEAAFYTYEGSDVVPNCEPMQWIVFSNTVNIDPSDFAKLGSITTSGARNLQPVGDREVFYNDTTLPHSIKHAKDGGLYLRCGGGRGGSSGGSGKTATLGEASEPAGVQAKQAQTTTEVRQIQTGNVWTWIKGEGIQWLLILGFAGVLGWLVYSGTLSTGIEGALRGILYPVGWLHGILHKARPPTPV